MEYCQWETFNATCDRGSVVVMQSARYGRMKHGRCADTDVYIGCSADVLSQMDDRCSGRQSCTMAIPDSYLHQQQPCPNDMMAYLEASFVCVRDLGLELPHGSCSGHPDSTVVSHPQGHLSSRSVYHSGHGSEHCPWVIVVQPGKTVDLYVIDFSLTARYHDVMTSADDADVAHLQTTGDDEYCHVYATVRELPGQGQGEGQSRDEVKICAGIRREQRVYSSVSNSLNVRLSPLVFDDPTANFLLKYVARGCADVRAPRNGWVQRVGNRVTVTCNFTSHTWHLVCRDTHWVGQISACDEGPLTERRVVTYDQFPTYGLVLAVVVGVFIGSVSGFTLLTAILCCKRTAERRLYAAGKSCKNTTLDNTGGCSDVELVSLRGCDADCDQHQQPMKPQHQHHLSDYCGYSHVWPVTTDAGSYQATRAASRSTQQRAVGFDSQSDHHSAHVEHTYRSPLLVKDYEQHRRQHYHQCVSSPYHQIFSSESTASAICNSRQACALSQEELEAAVFLQDEQTSKQATETAANRQGENHLNSHVTCSTVNPDITRVQTAQV